LLCLFINVYRYYIRNIFNVPRFSWNIFFDKKRSMEFGESVVHWLLYYWVFSIWARVVLARARSQNVSLTTHSSLGAPALDESTARPCKFELIGVCLNFIISTPRRIVKTIIIFLTNYKILSSIHAFNYFSHHQDVQPTVGRGTGFLNFVFDLKSIISRARISIHFALFSNTSCAMLVW